MPFDLTASQAFGLPIPELALAVREMEVEEVRALGSHRLFICRTRVNQPELKVRSCRLCMAFLKRAGNARDHSLLQPESLDVSVENSGW